MQYVARQAILDANRRLQAYELLFRDSLENHCPPGDLELASKRTMDTAVLLGLDALSDGHDIFLNCTHDLIVEGFPTLFPADLTVVEVLETVRPSPELVEACRALRRVGYRFALDDFTPQPGYEPLIEIADVIKVDFRLTSIAECKQYAATYGENGRLLLAEKVETEDEFRSAVDFGYSLFQGYLFSRPKILSTANVECFEANQLRMLAVLGKPQLDLVEVENVIKSDPALSYRLLRFLNSPAFYLQCEIRSILHALTLLGEDEARKWLLLTSAVLSLQSTSPHLLTLVLVRARFAELLAPHTRLSGSSLFIIGLLSLMDAILNIPKTLIADKVAVSDDIRAALKGVPNPLGQCLELVVSFENADWNRCEQLRETWQIPARVLSQSYLQAVKWAKQVSEVP